ncbi:GAF domain-containing protein [Edaphobacter acidisoli]|nr:GAF domain-containing protein [Edaphobacter acidisoli]
MKSAVQSDNRRHGPSPMGGWKVISILAVSAAAVLTAIVLTRRFDFTTAALLFGFVALCTVAILHARFLILAHREHRNTTTFLERRNAVELRHAEEAREKSLALARSAWREADALHKATLALTEDLRMNSVLDTLLDLLHQQIPYEAAQVLLIEAGPRMFLAREARPGGPNNPLSPTPDTLNFTGYSVLEQALATPNGLLISDTLEEKLWKNIASGNPVRSWLGIPLSASNQVIGMLCAANSTPGHFTAEHLRIARSLAASSALAIQNARLYECSQIYAAELSRRSHTA